MRACLIAAALALAGTPALAQPVRAIAGSEQPISDAAIRGDPERRICKQVTATGSRLKGGRVCKKAREWADEKLIDRKALERIQTQRSVKSP
jgi:hypothetical protein